MLVNMDILSSFPEEFENALPPFNSNGLIEPGDFSPTRTEFEERFVNIGDVDRRHSIYNGWNQHREALLHAGSSESSRQLLNGSFTTNKPSPGDIDIAVEVSIDDATPLAISRVKPISDLLQGPLMKTDYYCDAYPVYCLPIDHPQYEQITAKAIKYWTKWFARTRNHVPKGRIWATTGGLR